MSIRTFPSESTRGYIQVVSVPVCPCAQEVDEVGEVTVMTSTPEAGSILNSSPQPKLPRSSSMKIWYVLSAVQPMGTRSWYIQLPSFDVLVARVSTRVPSRYNEMSTVEPERSAGYVQLIG